MKWHNIMQGSQQALVREAQPARPVRQAPPRRTGGGGDETRGQGLHWKPNLEPCRAAEEVHLDGGGIEAADADQKRECGSFVS